MKGLIIKSARRTIMALVVIGLLNASMVWAQELPDNDDMIEEETEEEEFGMEVDDVVKMLRDVKCKQCPGLKSKPDCKIAHDYGCPKPKKP